MRRADVSQRLVNLYREARYLEIGVCEGYTFHAVDAASKVAVDPRFESDKTSPNGCLLRQERWLR